MRNKDKFFNKVIIFLCVLIVGVIVLLLFNNNSNSYQPSIMLKGNANVVIYQGEPYNETGYLVVSEDGDNTKYDVIVINDVNVNIVGNYTIKYQIKDAKNKVIEEAIRNVQVIENPMTSLVLTLNGDEVTNVLQHSTYIEPGAKATYNGQDISSSISVNGNVNTSILGEYQLTYTITLNGKTKTVTRTVKVFDITINTTIDYTKKVIKVSIENDDFFYVKLPNNAYNYNQSFEYSFSEIGYYEFIVYTKHGLSKSHIVNILSVDNKKPIGTCDGKILNGKTYLSIQASDESGILKYVYNNVSFTTASYVIEGKIYNPVVRVYDKYNNYTDLTCNVKASFDNNMDNITLSNTLTSCNNNWTSYNNELSSLMAEMGYKTRDAVAAAALYLAKFPYKVAYSWGGKYLEKGINPKWGCAVSVTKDVCTKSLGNMTCILGLDCTGYTAWAFIQAGFDKSIVLIYAQERSYWGNFNALAHKYSFTGNQDKVDLIKPGDLVHTEGHVGMVIGTSDTMLKVANMREGVKISYIKKSNGQSTNNDKSFDSFVLFDEFFAMYGN